MIISLIIQPFVNPLQQALVTFPLALYQILEQFLHLGVAKDIGLVAVQVLQRLRCHAQLAF